MRAVLSQVRERISQNVRNREYRSKVTKIANNAQIEKIADFAVLSRLPTSEITKNSPKTDHSIAIFLPNDFAFWQFSGTQFRVSGKLSKCKVIWQKMALELTILLSFFFLENLIFSWVYPENFAGGLCLIFFWAANYPTLSLCFEFQMNDSAQKVKAQNIKEF